MTGPRVTRCPHCNTSFRITPAQMNAANGSVRCGSCLQVFDAQTYFEHSNDTDAGQSEFSETVKKPENNTPDTDKAGRDNAAFSALSGTPDNSGLRIAEPSMHRADFNLDGTDRNRYDRTENNIESALKQINHAPINLNEIPVRSRKKTLFWGFFLLFFSVALIVQYAWFNKQDLSLHPSLRPGFEWLCKQFECNIPPLINIDAIKGTELVVRSHPDVDEALLVDLVIINTADYSQPYPRLQLSFTDINGMPVAKRQFRASEYLGGELAGSTKMPSGQPIRLGLEIIDPGQDAVSYDLSFFSDQTP